MALYDAMLIPGGGVKDTGEIPPWVKTRLDRAIEISDAEYIITLSAGTVHRPPPLDQNGFPIFESIAGGRYLINHGINPKTVLAETCSYDTVGNAYFSRVIHVEPRELRKLLIITSEFHMSRTKAIFQKMYSLDDPDGKYHLTFEAVPNVGVSPDDLQARIERESESLKQFLQIAANIHNMRDCHQWLFTEHSAYSLSSNSLYLPINDKSLNTY